MRVLSLFDGMGCGRLALERAGIKVDAYYASEIDQAAISVVNYHYPDTIQLGSIVDVRGDDLPQIDLLIGGSPCQGFSFSGKGLNFDDPRSKLFFEFVRLAGECRPKYFLLENVKMKKEWEDVITQYLGVDPIEINSSLVSAQNRVRLYWTNIPGITIPEDRDITIHDIVDTSIPIGGRVPTRYGIRKASIIGRRINDEGKRADYDDSVKRLQYLEVRDTTPTKSNCLTTVMKDNVLTTMPFGRHPNAFVDNLPFRYYTVEECCRLQTVPDDYFNGVVNDRKAYFMLGNGWTVDVVAHIFSFIPEDLRKS